MNADALSVYDHVRRSGDDDGGVYRVVGVSAEALTLLRVTNGRGRRRATGRVVSVDRAEVESFFEPATNPDAGIRPPAWLRNLAVGAVWEFRMLTGL